ncbi:prolyl oligopeptidase family serine peptidase [Aquidulcibacter sp.]|uniref:prolyl oligopeptidase family serine peptidase n=1 Tax=Aquidulcibacter sp. TaxID=2052990 RepID=UPI0025BA46F1|nr:prolyl oligopeptidase family serine peptidase [Aquidulcibacter sp.]MCA3692842.1 prolyl oligopeptidase family serine peptidase [Aquidulcibacter sp.]
MTRYRQLANAVGLAAWALCVVGCMEAHGSDVSTISGFQDNARPPRLLECLTVSTVKICMSEDQQILTTFNPSLGLSDGIPKLQRIALPSEGEEFDVLDFECKESKSSFCLVRTETRNSQENTANALFKIDLATNAVSRVGSGRFSFGPIFERNLSLIDNSAATPVFYKFNELTGELEEGWRSEKYGLLEGFLPAIYSENGRTEMLRFALDRERKIATIFEPTLGPKRILHDEMHTFFYGAWSAAPAGSSALFGVAVDFPRGAAPRSVAGLTQLHASVSGSGQISIQNFATDLDLPDELIQSIPPQVDKSGDIYVITGSKTGPALKFVCRNRAGILTLKALSEPSPLARLRVWASPLIAGVELRREAPGRRLSFQHFALSTGATGTNRNCETTTVLIAPEISAESHLPIIDQAHAQTFVLRLNQEDGSSMPSPALVITKSIMASPKSIIIDLYGAVGGTAQSPNEFIRPFDPLLDEHWVAQAILPGDGDFGRLFAMSSATPNRKLTVEAINELSERLIATFPTLAGNITLRAGSAGTSTAVQAALSRPDLYSGAIMFSGAYDWVLLGSNEDMAGFHKIQDQLELDAAITATPDFCYGTKFLLFHAHNDDRAPFSQAEVFASKLKAKRCLVGTIFTGGGGHSLSRLSFRSKDRATFAQIVHQRASTPLLKDLGLAQSQSSTRP